MKAYGTFVKKNNHLFRTEAYIQWGNSDKTIGTVIMLNPGMATLKVNNVKENSPIHDEIHIDPTMRALIELIEQFYDHQTIDGRVYIYNLFPLQHTKMDEAIEMFESLWDKNEPLVKSFPKDRQLLLERFKQSSWILFGWGMGKSTKNLSNLKREWLQLAEQSGTPVIGKKGKGPLDYYHPKPLLVSQQVEYRKEVVAQYKQLSEQVSYDNQLETIVNNNAVNRHLNNYVPIEEIQIGKYILRLYEILEEEFNINYIYRLFCFREDKMDPILVLNYETSMNGRFFYGASISNGHINLGVAPSPLSLKGFRKWALQNITQFVHDINQDLIYKKLNDFKPSKNKDSNDPVISIDELNRKRIEKIEKRIREFENRYEYCIVKDYEDKYSDFEIHAFELADIEVVLLETAEQIELVSIEFDKSTFTLDDALTWLQTYKLYFGPSNKQQHIVEDFGQLIESIKFKRNVIIIYTAGNASKVIDVNELAELTDTYKTTFRKIDTTKPKNIQHHLTIIVNGEIVKEIPKIPFDRQSDLIISNGNIVKADYMDEFEGGVGFYRNNDPDPIVSMVDHQTTVSIDLYENEDKSKLCIVEYKYLAEFEV